MLKLFVGILSLVALGVLFIVLFSLQDTDPPVRDSKKCPLEFDPPCDARVSCREEGEIPPCQQEA